MSRSEFDPDWRRVSDSLFALMRRGDADADCFVIFVERQSDKFVQFGYYPEHGLVLDLPEDPLAEDEFVRAHAFFQRYGVKGEIRTGTIINASTGEELGPAEPRFVFFMDLGDDVRLATHVV